MANYHKPDVGSNKRIGVSGSNSKSKKSTDGAARGAVSKTKKGGKEAGGMMGSRLGHKPTIKGSKFKLQK